jgi:hypothetical protein
MNKDPTSNFPSLGTKWHDAKNRPILKSDEGFLIVASLSDDGRDHVTGIIQSDGISPFLLAGPHGVAEREPISVNKVRWYTLLDPKPAMKP